MYFTRLLTAIVISLHFPLSPSSQVPQNYGVLFRCDQTGVVIMETRKFTQFIRFLEKDLAIPTSDLLLALRYDEQNPSLLPMVLWQYGLINLAQLDQIFNWLQELE